MKKYIISSALVLLAVSSVSAQETSNKGQVVRAMAPQMMMEEKITTGDPKIDAQIRALEKEMEAKIRQIREEYYAKIKALAGTKKLEKSKMGSTTIMRKDDDREKMMRGSTTPPRRDDAMKGSSTMMRGENGMMPGSTTPPRREDARPPMPTQAQGASPEVSVKGDNGFRSMFNKFFGR